MMRFVPRGAGASDHCMETTTTTTLTIVLRTQIHIRGRDEAQSGA